MTLLLAELPPRIKFLMFEIFNFYKNWIFQCSIITVLRELSLLPLFILSGVKIVANSVAVLNFLIELS